MNISISDAQAAMYVLIAWDDADAPILCVGTYKECREAQKDSGGLIVEAEDPNEKKPQ